MRILALFPIFIILVLAAVVGAIAQSAGEVIDVWNSENWAFQTLSAALWLSIACAVWGWL